MWSQRPRDLPGADAGMAWQARAGAPLQAGAGVEDGGGGDAAQAAGGRTFPP